MFTKMKLEKIMNGKQIKMTWSCWTRFYSNYLTKQCYVGTKNNTLNASQCHDNESQIDCHVNKLCTTSISTADLIQQNIVFENDAIVAVNKPAGVSVYGNSLRRESQTLISVQQCLPELSKKLHCSNLYIGLSLKSYYQGVFLLCKHEHLKTKLDKRKVDMQLKKSQYLSYLAITVGIPSCPFNTAMEKFIKREYIHDREMSTVSDNGSVTACRNGLMIHSKFTVKLLMSNRQLNVALVEISMNKDKWDSVEVLMSHFLSPVVGDNIYSSRVYQLKGIPFASCPYTSKPVKQVLPPAVERAIEKCGHNELPLLVHRCKISLDNFPDKGAPSSVIKCHPQDMFLDVLKCLELYDETLL